MFGSCFGIRPFSFSMSLMFIFMPPGITMSPGFWSALQAPSHFASIVVVVSRGTPAGTALAVRGRLDGIGGIEIAGDLGMRGDRHAGDAADGIADIAGRGLLDVLLGADLLGHRRERRAHLLVGGRVGAMLHRHVGHRRAGPARIFISHRPALRTGSSTARGVGRRQRSTAGQVARHNERSCRVMLRAPGCCSDRLEMRSGSVERAQRPVVGAIGHPAAGERDVAAIIGLAPRGISPPCRSRRSGRPRAGAASACVRQRIGDDAAGVVALERRHPIGLRRRARQHPAHGNQARRHDLSHRRLHFARRHLRAHRRRVKRTAGGRTRTYRQVLPRCT